MNIFKQCMAILFLAGLASDTHAINLLEAIKFYKTPPVAIAEKDRLPIVYHEKYDISMFGVEKIHPFDSTKYSKVYNSLCQKLQLHEQHFHAPNAPITDQELLAVHGKAYLDSLNYPSTIAQITYVLPLAWLPNFILQKKIVDPMRYATAGTLLATRLALEHGWAINLSGGYHHAKTHEGGGFCVFGDIQLAVKQVLQEHPDWKVLIVDLDAHQGNGYAEGLEDEKRAFIFDIYGSFNYPHDVLEMGRINYNFPVQLGITGEKYLELLQSKLPTAIDEIKPNLIIYNAGTDIYATDAIGKMSVSKDDIAKRDQFVFEQAKKANAPIVMLLSGGYTRESAGIIADSLVQIINNNRSN